MRHCFLTRSILAAACCVPLAVGAAEFCVADAVELEATLVVAVTNGAADQIRLRKGTYLAPPDGFQLPATLTDFQQPIALIGGWSEDCSASSDDPRTTVVDGGGASPGLVVSNPASLTFWNGSIDIE